MTFLCIILLFLFKTLTQTSSFSPNNINVVIFFAESNKISNEASGPIFLDMKEVTRIKHNLGDSHNIPPYLAQRGALDCKESLRTGLDSLMHFCQNALGMKTAIVTIWNKQITNEITKQQPNYRTRSSEVIHEGHNHHKYPISSQHRIPHNSAGDQKSSDLKIKKLNLKDLVTSPEHTEVFKIRVKRQNNEEDEKIGEIVDVPLGKDDTKKPWDVLDIMSHVRFSFFGKLFENEPKNLFSGEDAKILSEVGHIKQDPGLFETVKSTLTSFQETPGEAFLMVVFGGHLSEVCDKQSPLVQSLKHVMECTDPQKTLIILTGSCPDCDERQDNVVVIKEGASKENRDVPVYAKGARIRHFGAVLLRRFVHESPKSENLMLCKELYDIPMIIKNILEETSPIFDNAIIQTRPKRSLFYNVPKSSTPRNGSINNFKLTTLLKCMTLIFIYINYIIINIY